MEGDILHIDNLSHVMAFVAILAAIAMLFAHIHVRREQRQHIAHLHKKIDALHQQNTKIRDPHFRELCCAIRTIYPQAMRGVDYQIEDDGSGPKISEWFYDAPQPDEAKLKQVIDDMHEGVHHYRELRRAAYPPLEDQLDALYKSRKGDDSDLQAIEQKILEVKARYPKGDACDPSCEG